VSGQDHHRHAPEAGSWDEFYRASQRVWSGNPNPQVVAEITGLAPGRALDVGCGEGADAIWLAGQGWDVVAVDISAVALERAAQHVGATHQQFLGSIEWRQADLVSQPPEPASFDLVSSQFMQLPPDPRTRLFTALVGAVRPGGTLLVVGHHPSDVDRGVRRPPSPELFYTADAVADLLDGRWTVVVNEARPRTTTTPEGVPTTIHDAVLRATRRP
jgi:SAM-dependent methyltransferase